MEVSGSGRQIKKSKDSLATKMSSSSKVSVDDGDGDGKSKFSDPLRKILVDFVIKEREAGPYSDIGLKPQQWSSVLANFNSSSGDQVQVVVLVMMPVLAKSLWFQPCRV